MGVVAGAGLDKTSSASISAPRCWQDTGGSGSVSLVDPVSFLCS
jgi:hypothetical protein